MAATALTERPRAPIERTEHPHVVKSADMLGGEPRVVGTRMPVRQIAAMYAAGTTVEELMRDFPPLTPAQIHDAISYAPDHPQEMAYHEERHKLRNILRKYNLVYYQGRRSYRSSSQRSNCRLMPSTTPGKPSRRNSTSDRH